MSARLQGAEPFGMNRANEAHDGLAGDPGEHDPHAGSATPISIERARFEVEMQRLRGLREEQPPERGVDPMSTSPDLVRGVARAAGIWSVKRIADALGMGRSTVHEWIARAHRGGARARFETPAEAWLGDAEISALCRCISALDAVDRDARQRVLNYLDERYFGKAKVKP